MSRGARASFDHAPPAAALSRAVLGTAALGSASPLRLGPAFRQLERRADRPSLRRALLAAVLSLAPLGALRAEDAPDATPERAVLLLARGQVNAAIALARSGTASAASASQVDRARRFELAHAVARAVRFARTREDDEAEVARTLDLAASRASVDDLAFVRLLSAATPESPAYARILERGAIRSVARVADDARLAALLSEPDEDVRRQAVVALVGRLRALRKKVEDGGTLTRAEQARLSGTALVDALVTRLGDRPRGSDALAQDLAEEAAAGATALHALVLIETPALVPLEGALRAGSSDAAAALRAIRAAIGMRLTRHPRSTWSSARGELPAVLVATLPCPTCGRALSPAARVCAGCGQKASSALCPRCGVPLREGAFCALCGGGPATAGTSRRCASCGEEAGPDAAYCRRCGTALEAKKKPRD